MVEIRIRSHAFKELKSLPEPVVAAVDKMLLDGKTAMEVANWLQGQGHFTDAKTPSVKKMLERYRASELRKRVMNQIADAQIGAKTVAGVVQRVNACDALTELVIAQQGRFYKALELEKKAPLLMKNVQDEGRLLKDMLTDLGKLQLETGVLLRASRSFKGIMTDPNTGDVKHFDWTEEQASLLREIDKIAQEVADAV